jgi:shikimate dehydrogenase
MSVLDVIRYAVLGNPIAHSRSPEIHQAFARQLGRRIEYTRRLVPMQGFAAEIAEMRSSHFAGANVTVPFKENAFAVADRVSERARHAGAANTLTFREDATIDADNTDGAGLIKDLTVNLGRALEGASILLVGAGGAARGVIHPLAALCPARLVVCNRSPEKASALVALLRRSGDPSIDAIESAARPLDANVLKDLGDFDLVINSTSASLDGRSLDLPGTCFSSRTLAYDIAYGKGITPFLSAARSGGAEIADGLGMLVEQAAESFSVWHAARPDTAPVITAMRASLPPF